MSRPRAWWRSAYSRNERLWLTVIVVVAVAVRVGWVVLAARRAVMGDPVAYTYHGAQLARGQGYRSFFAAYTPAMGSSGATVQSEPNASRAPASSSERKA